MSQPPAMTVATRRKKVRRLVERDPNLSARAIAAQLGVSKDTVRRDLDAIRHAQRHTEPDGDRLVLVLDEPLRQALAALRSTIGAPDTPEQNRAAARAAIRSVADTVLEAQQIATPEGSRP